MSVRAGIGIAAMFAVATYSVHKINEAAKEADLIWNQQAVEFYKLGKYTVKSISDNRGLRQYDFDGNGVPEKYYFGPGNASLIITELNGAIAKK